MILAQLKDYIAAHGSVTAKELAQHFALSEDGVDAMLGVWMRKGVVSKMVDTNKQHQITRIRYTLTDKQGLSVNVTM